MFRTLALAVVAGSTATASAQNFLWFEDATVGTSAYGSALTTLGYTSTFTNDPNTFASLLSSGTWDGVISATQGSTQASIIGAPLVTWASSNPGKPLLISDWSAAFDPTAQAYLAALGFTFTGGTNFTQVNPVSGGVFNGLPAATLTNPGYGIFSVEGTGAVAEATDEFANNAVTRNGTIFFNGFLSDTFSDGALGTDYVVRELKVPAPGSLALLGLGGLAATRRRRA